MASCTDYCTTILANCSGNNAQYGGADPMVSCMASCQAFPTGTAADMSGNTRGCRVYHAGAAAADAALHCPHAGAGGGGACGNPCDHYCDVVADACSTEYATRDACMTACADILTDPTNETATAGDTLQCRIYHAQAAQNDPATHCAHVGVMSAPCSDMLPDTANNPCTMASDFVSKNSSGSPVQVATTSLPTNAYTPKCLKVRAGTQVTIDASVVHPLKGINANSPWETMSYTTAQTRTLSTAGVYPYYCTNHGSPTGTGMAGAVWVVP